MMPLEGLPYPWRTVLDSEDTDLGVEHKLSIRRLLAPAQPAARVRL
jgi:hypothetical protein